MKQPKALYLLAGVQMWEYFSFYGMRALLVLYMINQMHVSEPYAFGVYAVYSGLVELGGILGGRIADRFLGLKKTILLGGWLIAAGHICMTMEFGFYVGLALIVVGSCLFTPNISALLGLFYEQNDTRREEGFTIFYVAINLGGLLATILCGVVGERFGWHYGFGLAAIGMIMGNLAFMTFHRLLQNKGDAPTTAPKQNRWILSPFVGFSVVAVAIGIGQADLLLPLLPWVSIACIGYVMTRLYRSSKIALPHLIKLGLYLGALAIFFAAEEQIGSSLIVFSEKFSNHSVLPSSSIFAINPLTIIVIGPFLNRLLRRSSAKGHNFPFRIVCGLGIAALAFGSLYLASVFYDSMGSVPFLAIAETVLVISVAELLIAPTVYSYCSEIAPENEKGEVMGLIPLGFSLASFIGGHICTSIDTSSLTNCGTGFAYIALLLVSVALIIAAISAVKGFKQEVAYEKN